MHNTTTYAPFDQCDLAIDSLLAAAQAPHLVMAGFCGDRERLRVAIESLDDVGIRNRVLNFA